MMRVRLSSGNLVTEFSGGALSVYIALLVLALIAIHAVEKEPIQLGVYYPMEEKKRQS